ncbi:hypothetical protein C882_1785 [Caenispirillum salinarum AK4]|uniref:Uncharacterized protein n=1 Tax=Caenispirillum salinarum AK4 TaxID=1238182 RepID=K9H9J2_9PROT|nr:hypothetical protein [Caenispirillum salinarum]EKV27283.1 hypothetical protein C882_1785 [Caenispirillum salinarum AK4]
MCSRSIQSNIDAALVVGPHDDVAWLGTTPAGEGVYAVVHRRGGVFTHLYRVAEGAVRGRGGLVHLEAVLPGGRLREARQLAAYRLSARLDAPPVRAPLQAAE